METAQKPSPDAFQDAFAEIAQQLHRACGVRVLWKDADPRTWRRWPVALSQHRNPYCRAIKRSRQRLAACCRADTTAPSESGVHRRRCPFGVVEQVVPFRRGSRMVGWCFVGAWRERTQSEHIDLPTEQAAKAAAAAELTRRMVGGILHLHEGSPSGDDPRLVTAMTLIDEHLDAGLRAATVARGLHLSTSRFVHWFAEAAGQSFSDYVHDRLMARAAELLLDPQRSVTEVAMTLSFSSPAYFSTAFKRHFGQPPARWRLDMAGRGE